MDAADGQLSEGLHRVRRFSLEQSVKLKSLLVKAPEFRSVLELSAIEAMLMRNPFFKNLREQTDSPTLRNCATWVRFESFKEGEV